jgi:hypothetical protein
MELKHSIPPTAQKKVRQLIGKIYVVSILGYKGVIHIQFMPWVISANPYDMLRTMHGVVFRKRPGQQSRGVGWQHRNATPTHYTSGTRFVAVALDTSRQSTLHYRLST